MARWSVRIEPKADKDLARLGAEARSRVLHFLHQRVAELHDPRQLGGPLHGQLAGFWKYRVGDVRIIAKIVDAQVLILIVEIGHRSEVYRRPAR